MIDSDRSWDELYSPSAFPSPTRQSVQPPPIRYGEITTSGRQAIGLAQLLERRHYDGHTGQAGLALVDPDTLRVTLTVFDPALRRVVWRGDIGQIQSRQMQTDQQRENAVRQLVSQATNQTFNPHRANAPGADLVPRSQNLQQTRRPASQRAVRSVQHPPRSSVRPARTQPMRTSQRRRRLPNHFDEFSTSA
jgi:hypothetical protein